MWGQNMQSEMEVVSEWGMHQLGVKSEWDKYDNIIDMCDWSCDEYYFRKWNLNGVDLQ